MRGAQDPKQAVIQNITDSSPHARREEWGTLAKTESIRFLKERHFQYIHAFLVTFTSTTNRVVYTANIVLENNDGSFSSTTEISSGDETCFTVHEEYREMYQQQPWLNVFGAGKEAKSEQVKHEEASRHAPAQKTATGYILKIGSSKKVTRDVPTYSFWVGALIPNGHTVARVHMIPQSGPVEIDEVQENMVFFLSESLLPLAFEFYGPSNELLATQVWDQ